MTSAFRFIKHRNMKDVCFQVFGTHYDLYSGRWWNIANGEPFPLKEETIKIRDIENWDTKYDPKDFQKGGKS